MAARGAPELRAVRCQSSEFVRSPIVKRLRVTHANSHENKDVLLLS